GNWGRPGIILIDVPEASNARCAFELQEDTWNQEKAFGNEWFSILRVTAWIPALVPFTRLNTISSLRLALTESLDTVSNISELPSDAETVAINNNGTITPL